MLLAGFRQFNLAIASVAVVLVVTSSVVCSDEVRRWRDKEGNLHVTITGAPEESPSGAGRTEDSTTDPEQRFSVETSLRRRELEKRLRMASAELARVRERASEIKSKRLIVYSPPAPLDGENSQFALDAQRNAFLQVRAFEHERQDQLRKLRHDERDWLMEIRHVWKEFDGLRAEVRSAYGNPPSWWRDHLDCPGCLTAPDVEQALKRPDKARSGARATRKARAQDLEPQTENDAQD